MAAFAVAGHVPHAHLLPAAAPAPRAHVQVVSPYVQVLPPPIPPAVHAPVGGVVPEGQVVMFMQVQFPTPPPASPRPPNTLHVQVALVPASPAYVHIRPFVSHPPPASPRVKPPPIGCVAGHSAELPPPLLEVVPLPEELPPVVPALPVVPPVVLSPELVAVDDPPDVVPAVSPEPELVAVAVEPPDEVAVDTPPSSWPLLVVLEPPPHPTPTSAVTAKTPAIPLIASRIWISLFAI